MGGFFLSFFFLAIPLLCFNQSELCEAGTDTAGLATKGGDELVCGSPIVHLPLSYIKNRPNVHQGGLLFFSRVSIEEEEVWLLKEGGLVFLYPKETERLHRHIREQ